MDSINRKPLLLLRGAVVVEPVSIVCGAGLHPDRAHAVVDAAFACMREGLSVSAFEIHRQVAVFRIALHENDGAEDEQRARIREHVGRLCTALKAMRGQ